MSSIYKLLPHLTLFAAHNNFEQKVITIANLEMGKQSSDCVSDGARVAEPVEGQKATWFPVFRGAALPVVTPAFLLLIGTFQSFSSQ